MPGLDGLPLTEQQRKLFEMSQQGLSGREIARQLGKDPGYVNKTLQRIRRKLGADTSQGVRSALRATQLDGLEATHGWAKVDGHSVFWRNEAARETGVGPDELLERMRQAFEDIPAVKPTAAEAPVEADLLNVVPIPDAHVGLHSWGKETGEDYDLKLATARVTGAVSEVLQTMPRAGTTLLLNLGDFNHAENDEARTPASKHALDIDGRHYKTLEASIRILAACIDEALARSGMVIYRGLPGNHDPYTTCAITLALSQRYRDEPRVDIVTDPSAHFFMQWVKVMLGAHHGDGVKPERLVMHMADVAAEIWGQTTFRHFFTGHLHHFKAQDIGGVLWEQLRAVCPRDAYAAKHAYSARASLLGITLHRERGEMQRVSRHL